MLPAYGIGTGREIFHTAPHLKNNKMKVIKLGRT